MPVSRLRPLFRRRVLGVGEGGDDIPGRPFAWFDAELINQNNNPELFFWVNAGTEEAAGWVSQRPQFFTNGGPDMNNRNRVFFDNFSSPSHYMQTPAFAPRSQPSIVAGVIESQQITSFNTVCDSDNTLNGWEVRVEFTTGVLLLNAGASLLGGINLSNAWHWFVAEFNGVSSRIRTSAGDDVSGNAGTQTMGRVRIAASAIAGTVFAGNMALLGMWDDGTPGDDVVAYMTTRYPGL